MVQDEYREKSERLAGTIIDKVPHIDVVTVWFPYRPALIRKLAGFCEGGLNEFFGPMGYRDRKTGEWRTVMPIKYRYKAVLLQPRPEAIQFVLSQKEHDYMITYVELALDFITRTLSDARALLVFFKRTLIKKWPGKQRQKSYRGTVYTGARGASIRHAIYARFSKVRPHSPCCHFELRLKGTGVIRRTLLSTRAHDSRTLWNKFLQLRCVNEKAVHRYVRRDLQQRVLRGEMIYRRRLPFDKRCEFNTRFLLDLCEHEVRAGGPQKISDLIAGYGLRWECLTTIPNDPFLP